MDYDIIMMRLDSMLAESKAIHEYLLKHLHELEESDHEGMC